jgi:hypothetical protein
MFDQVDRVGGTCFRLIRFISNRIRGVVFREVVLVAGMKRDVVRYVGKSVTCFQVETRHGKTTGVSNSPGIAGVNMGARYYELHHEVT